MDSPNDISQCEAYCPSKSLGKHNLSTAAAEEEASERIVFIGFCALCHFLI